MLLTIVCVAVCVVQQICTCVASEPMRRPSARPSVCPVLTGCLDYIWWWPGEEDEGEQEPQHDQGGGGGGSRLRLRPLEVLWPPTLSALEPFKGCPNAAYPSDHLCLAATFAL